MSRALAQFIRGEMEKAKRTVTLRLDSEQLLERIHVRGVGSEADDRRHVVQAGNIFRGASVFTNTHFRGFVLYFVTPPHMHGNVWWGLLGAKNSRLALQEVRRCKGPAWVRKPCG